MQKYGAHFHIDILPDYQRNGMGRKFIDIFCSSAQKQGAKGVHLIMAGDNITAGKFYEAVGFQRFPRVLDNGKSGENGKTADNSIWYCKNF